MAKMPSKATVLVGFHPAPDVVFAGWVTKVGNLPKDRVLGRRLCRCQLSHRM